MALTRSDRFRLKSEIVRALSDTDDWSLAELNLLLNEFGLGSIDSWGSQEVAEAIASISDRDLVEMYSLVFRVDTQEVADVVESTDDGRWQRGYVRLFLTHSAKHRDFVGEVARALAVVGIHAFVAHDTMEYSKPWQAQIELHLRSMQAFVAIIHPEFNQSAWCHQEAGWALGRRVPRYAVRMGANPEGFLGSDQWPSGLNSSPKEVARIISAWIATLPELGDAVVDGLLEAMASVGNYIDAGAAAERMAALGTLTDEQFRKLAEVWWSNDQLHGGVLPTKALEPLYWASNRTWPPPRPIPPTVDEPF